MSFQMVARNLFPRAMAAVIAVGLVTSPSKADVIERDQIVIVDGDSVRVGGQEWRLLGYDTPEIERAHCEAERRLALVAKARLAAMLAAAREIRLEANGVHDRYKRPLGDLLLDGVNPREMLIAELLARPYNGGVRKGWCSRDSRDDLIPGQPPGKR